MTQTPTRILPRPHGRLPQTTHLHKVKIKTCSDRIHCQHKSKNSTPPSKSQVSCPGLTNLVCSSTGTTVDSLHGSTSVQPTKHTPCRFLLNLQTNSRPKNDRSTILMIRRNLYKKNRVSKSPEPNRLQPTSHSLVTLYFQIITSCETGAP